MRNTLKKMMVVVMAFALLVGALAVPSQTAQAASKLTKADFKFTGMYKSGLNKILKSSYDWDFNFANIVDEDAPKKCIKTKRGITLTATKKHVFKKYGNVSVKKLGKKTNLYKRCKKGECGVNSETFKLVKKDKCAVYQYKSGSDKYQLHFFFSSKNTVDMIIVSKNC